MQTRHNHGWPRRGIALLWDFPTLETVCPTGEVRSLRELFALSADWPEDPPSNGGNTLVVAGLEGCLDLLGPGDAETWLLKDLRRVVLSFQDHYGGDAGLVFWIPRGRDRLAATDAGEAYGWRRRGAEPLPLGRLLFSGAESEAKRLLDVDPDGVDPDGPHWIGLHLSRIS